MRLGKKELETVIRSLAAYLQTAPDLTTGERSYIQKLLDKVKAESERKAAPLSAAGAVGVNAGPIHQALVLAANPKVPNMAEAGPGWWARASRRFAEVGATPEKAGVLGRWILAQTWLDGQVGWNTILSKWEDWYARASQSAATEASPAVGRRKASW